MISRETVGIGLTSTDPMLEQSTGGEIMVTLLARNSPNSGDIALTVPRKRSFQSSLPFLGGQTNLGLKEKQYNESKGLWHKKKATERWRGGARVAGEIGADGKGDKETEAEQRWLGADKSKC